MASPWFSVISPVLYNSRIASIRCNIIRHQSTNKVNTKLNKQIKPRSKNEFRVLVIPGHTKEEPKEDPRKKRRAKSTVLPPPRYRSMAISQDWTDVWPTAHTFKYSAVPFPVRQGYAKGEENDGISPGKYGNAELMKIPNFLHLSPAHVKKHCAAIKKYCTDWPSGLETSESCEQHFPLTCITQDYIFDGASLQDPRARVVKMKFKLSKLELDYHARDKFIRLVGEHYDPDTDIVTLKSQRCPMKKQNLDYMMYLLTAVYFESWNIEEWESEKEEQDMENYTWEMTASKQNLLETVKNMRKMATNAEDNVPDYLEKVDEESSNTIENLEQVKQYKESLVRLHDDGEDIQALNAYKESVVELLIGAKSRNISSAVEH